MTSRFHVMPTWSGFLGIVVLEEQGNAEFRLVNKSPWCEPHAAQTSENIAVFSILEIDVFIVIYVVRKWTTMLGIFAARS